MYKIKIQKREEIEPEEIFLDPQELERKKKGRLEIPIKNSIFSFLFVLFLLLNFALFARTFYLITARGDDFIAKAENNYQRVFPIEAPRGAIYSSDDILLADSAEEEVEKTDEAGNKIKVKKFSRFYNEGYYFSHILGYVNQVSAEEIENDQFYELGDRIGREGIEKEYEEFLRGEKGKVEKVVNSKGKFLPGEKTTQPLQGSKIVLNINASLQKKIYEMLKEKIPDKKATVIALNPQTGEILSSVSSPSYDNNLISEKYSQYSEDPQKPLLNRVLAGFYPSGSIIKPLIAAAALEEETISADEKINCPGHISIPNPYNPSSPTIKKDWKAHGITDLKKSLAQSCNVYFFSVGGGGNQNIQGKKIEGLGIERIKKYLDLFYLEDKVGIDIPGEKVGFVPTLEWFNVERKETEKRNWSIADVYDVSIGQGFFRTTPLHLAVALSAIANGGKILKPKIVNKIESNEGNLIKKFEPEILSENFIKKENIEAVREGMRECVLTGSCRQLISLSVSSAGKTGTAESEGAKDPHSWFVSFAPYENPEILILVLVEYGGSGEKVAGPIAKEALNYYFSEVKKQNSLP